MSKLVEHVAAEKEKMRVKAEEDQNIKEPVPAEVKEAAATEKKDEKPVDDDEVEVGEQGFRPLLPSQQQQGRNKQKRPNKEKPADDREPKRSKPTAKAKSAAKANTSKAGATRASLAAGQLPAPSSPGKPTAASSRWSDRKKQSNIQKHETKSRQWRKQIIMQGGGLEGVTAWSVFFSTGVAYGWIDAAAKTGLDCLALRSAS